jgi:hypothetical protein
VPALRREGRIGSGVQGSGRADHLSFYWDNFIYFGLGPKRGPDGKLAITIPIGDKPLPSIAAEDIGKAAYGIFKRGPEMIGKTVAIAGGALTGKEMAAGLSRALGQDVVFNSVPPAVYRTFGFPGVRGSGEHVQYNAEFSDYFAGIRDVDETRKLNPELQSFDQWLAKHRDQIPVE